MTNRQPTQCPHCGLPKFWGVANYAGDQCKCLHIAPPANAQRFLEHIAGLEAENAALRAKLAAYESHEPAARVIKRVDDEYDDNNQLIVGNELDYFRADIDALPVGTQLYTAPEGEK